MRRTLWMGLLIVGVMAGMWAVAQIEATDLGAPGQPRQERQPAPSAAAEAEANPPAADPPQQSVAPPPARSQESGSQKPVAAFWFVLPER